MCVCLCACEKEIDANCETSTVVKEEEEEENSNNKIDIVDAVDDDDDDYVFIDVQGFKTIGNMFIVKEFCLLDKDYEYHKIVKSPCLYNELSDVYKREAQWLTMCHHGLTFNSGDTTITELITQTVEHVQGRKKMIVVKGVEKCEWVREIYRNSDIDVQCVNVEEHHPSFRFAQNFNLSTCAHHSRIIFNANCNCAQSHARQLRDLYI